MTGREGRQSVFVRARARQRGSAAIARRWGAGDHPIALTLRACRRQLYLAGGHVEDSYTWQAALPGRHPRNHAFTRANMPFSVFCRSAPRARSHHNTAARARARIYGCCCGLGRRGGGGGGGGRRGGGCPRRRHFDRSYCRGRRACVAENPAPGAPRRRRERRGAAAAQALAAALQVRRRGSVAGGAQASWVLPQSPARLLADARCWVAAAVGAPPPFGRSSCRVD